ncbi:MAG: hypothetical protein ABW051_07295 [Burkholderiaceae bacterium]
MRRDKIQNELARMAAQEGVYGCALVDVEGGMVMLSAGTSPDIETVGEAASDHWRLHRRHSGRFSPLGPLQAISLIHKELLLTLIPCGEGAVMATISRRMGLDMGAWYRDVTLLGRMLAEP